MRNTINQQSDFNQDLLEKAINACINYILLESEYPKEYHLMVRHIEASLPSATYNQISYSDVDLYVKAAIVDALVNLGVVAETLVKQIVSERIESGEWL